MQIFEFVLVMVSLILAIGFTSLLTAVAAMISHWKTRTVEWYLLVWIGTLFLYVPGYWWSLWDFREVNWNFPAYFFLLLMPTCLYIAMRLFGEALEVDDRDSSIVAFERVRVPFFSSLVVMQIAGGLDGWFLSVEPLLNELRWAQIVLTASFIIGAMTSNQTTQRAIALLNFVILVFAMFGLRYLPGAFGA